MSTADSNGPPAPPQWRELGQRLKRAREKARLTQKDVAEKFNISEQSVSQWELGRTRPELTKIAVLARLYKVSEQALLNPEVMEITLPLHGRRVTLINRIEKGRWEEVAEISGDDEDRFVIIEDTRVSDRAFALEIAGEANVPEFKPGDVVIIDPDVEPLPGDMVAARLSDSDQAVLRRYRPKGRDSAGRPVYDLAPFNQDWPTLHIDAANPGEILGTMIEHRRYRARSRPGYRGP